MTHKPKTAREEIATRSLPRKMAQKPSRAVNGRTRLQLTKGQKLSPAAGYFFCRARQAPRDAVAEAVNGRSRQFRKIAGMNQPNGNPTPFVTEAKSKLGWYYEVCTDHTAGGWVKEKDFKDFAYVAASLTRVNMAIEDPVNENIYKARAAKYEKWRDALYAVESKKSWAQRIWQRFFAPN
jgi:hypothetical protein